MKMNKLYEVWLTSTRTWKEYFRSRKNLSHRKFGSQINIKIAKMKKMFFIGTWYYVIVHLGIIWCDEVEMK